MPEELVFNTLSELYVDGKEEDIFLIYGESGVGKSLLASQFPDVLVLGCDPGSKGGLPRTALAYNPKVIRITSYQQLNVMIPLLHANAGTAFKSLAVDSVSFLGRLCMGNILSSVGRELPRFDEWNLNAERMRKILERLVEIPVPIIFTALPGTVKDEVTGKITGGPDLPGKLAGELARYCDVVIRLYMRSSYDKSGKLVPSYRYTVAGDDTWYAKDRTGLIKEKEGETSFEAIRPIFQITKGE